MSLLDREPVDRIQLLDETGAVVDAATLPDLDDAALIDIYEEMCLVRHFDDRAVTLQRQGRMGTFPPLRGQEAAQIGSTYALDDEDWVFSSYREHGVAASRGLPLETILRYWMGDERGSRVPEDLNLFTLAIPIATHLPHAAGLAWGARYRGDDLAVCCHFGDGATSEGDFHEALNFAGVFDLPVVFVCHNNQWAISVPRDRQTAAETLAQKASAYGFPGVQVDGMDPLAVYQVTREALDTAKNDGQPTLIEAVQYRFGAHTTADDPDAYRDDREVREWRRRDPIPRLETFLRETGRLDDETVDAIEENVRDRVDEAVEAAEATTRPHPDDLFEYVFDDLPQHLRDQRQSLRRLRERVGDEAILEG